MKKQDFDELNWSYFQSLYQRKLNGANAARERVRIFEPGSATPAPGTLLAYPTAIAGERLMTHLPFVDYSELVKPGRTYAETARRAVLWIKKMQAGTGSSMTRHTYLARVRELPLSDVRIGAKGTDLYIELPDGRISLVEAQLLQSIHDAQAGHFARIDLHDILGPETRESLDAVWNKKSRPDPLKSYEELVAQLPGVRRSGFILQAHMPTLDRSGQLSNARTAPGGHGLFAVDALRAAYIDTLRPDAEGRPLVSVVGNGEDLSSTPDPAMVGWMIETGAPIVMVTTEKTSNDLKGGQIALVSDGDSVHATIIEQAQAKEAGQLELFEKLGLREGDRMAFFNTNMALFNYDVLAPKLKALVAEIGEEEFQRIISPDLIENWKGEFLQLEGAMGSSLLNLDRYWRKHRGEPLVHFINVAKEERTRFFSPIKSAFDFFMQFHSDRFGFDPHTLRLINRRPGRLPLVSLTDKAYADIERVLASFAGASLLDLEVLSVEGQVDLRGIALRGTVQVANPSGIAFDLSSQLKSQGKPSLENQRVEIQADGTIRIYPLSIP